MSGDTIFSAKVYLAQDGQPITIPSQKRYPCQHKAIITTMQSLATCRKIVLKQIPKPHLLRVTAFLKQVNEEFGCHMFEFGTDRNASHQVVHIIIQNTYCTIIVNMDDVIVQFHPKEVRNGSGITM